MISVEKLSKSYGTKQVLHSIDLTFDKGKVYGIVGENGAGKTTLFRCIAGLESHSGHIKSDLEPLKDRLGLLHTNPYFMSKITGGEYLQLLCQARNIFGIDIDEKNIFDLPLHQYADIYSTGMKKKLALTAILLQNNEYFILDEPFNGVDIQSNIIILEIIHKLRSLNKTVIIASHIFSTLNDTCDEICLLQNGTVARQVTREGFDQLGLEMKNVLLGNLIEKLDLK